MLIPGGMMKLRNVMRWFSPALFGLATGMGAVGPAPATSVVQAARQSIQITRASQPLEVTYAGWGNIPKAGGIPYYNQRKARRRARQMGRKVQR